MNLPDIQNSIDGRTEKIRVSSRELNRVAGLTPKLRKFNRTGRGTKRTPGTMNKVEAKYHAHLERLANDGSIAWFAFERFTFKLADDTRYTPDFAVMLNDGVIECHEVKGGKKNKTTGASTFWCEEDAKLKIKLAAEIIPLKFSIVFPTPDGWGRKDF